MVYVRNRILNHFLMTWIPIFFFGFLPTDSPLEVSPTGYHLHWLQLSPSSPIRVGIYYLCTHVLDLLPVRPLAPRLSQLPFQLGHSSLQTSDFLFCSGHAFAIFQYNRGQVRIIRIGCRPYIELRLQFSASRKILQLARK